MEPVYCRHLGTNKKFSDYQGVLIFQFRLYDKAPFGTITSYISVWIIQVSLFSSVLINRLHFSYWGYITDLTTVATINMHTVIIIQGPYHMLTEIRML